MGNKVSSTEVVDGKEEKTTFSYDDTDRLTKLEGPDGTITYSYDKNGNRIAQEKNNEKLEYIYDTENRLLAVKDKDGLLMAALYDGDDNRVFTASRKEGKNTYQLFRRKEKEQKTTNGRKSPKTSPNGEENSLFWYGFSQNVLKSTAYVAGEFLSVNDVYRVVTGRDPLTGEKASRLEAVAWLTLDVLTLGSSKVGKVAKIGSKVNKIADVIKGSKANDL